MRRLDGEELIEIEVDDSQQRCVAEPAVLGGASDFLLHQVIDIAPFSPQHRHFVAM